MTDADWLLLKKMAADPQDRRFVEWSLQQGQLELECLRSRADSFGRGAKTQDQTLERQWRSRQNEFLDRVHEGICAFINRAENDSAFRKKTLPLEDPHKLVGFIARKVYVHQSLQILEQLASASGLPSSGSAVPTDHGTTHSDPVDSAADAVTNASKPIGNGDQFLAELMSSGDDQFSEEEIRICLKELQEVNGSAGLELKDFISELERMVEES